jgi:hypothetical protein
MQESLWPKSACAGVKLAPCTGFDTPYLRGLAEASAGAGGEKKIIIFFRGLPRTVLEALFVGIAAMALAIAAPQAVRPFAPETLWKSAPYQGGFWTGAMPLLPR